MIPITDTFLKFVFLSTQMSGVHFDSLLVSEFTRDPVAERDSVCQQTSCQAIISKGQPYIYVGRKNGKPGCYFCASCCQCYQAQPNTIMISQGKNSWIHKTAFAEWFLDAHGSIPDVNMIQHSMSAAYLQSIYIFLLSEQCLLITIS